MGDAGGGLGGSDSGPGFEIVGSTIVHEGHFVTEALQMRTPEGDVVDRLRARHPGAVAVVAIHEGSLVLVRQYRAAIDAELVEIPAGKRDVDGEPLEVTARRELIEEVGLDPIDLELLGSFVTAAGFTNEELWIFVTRNCRAVPRTVDGVEEAHSEVLRVPIADVDDLLRPDGLTDAKSIIGLTWARDQGWFDDVEASSV